jgi:hypothetical protein
MSFPSVITRQKVPVWRAGINAFAMRASELQEGLILAAPPPVITRLVRVIHYNKRKTNWIARIKRAMTTLEI